MSVSSAEIKIRNSSHPLHSIYVFCEQKYNNDRVEEKWENDGRLESLGAPGVLGARGVDGISEFLHMNAKIRHYWDFSGAPTSPQVPKISRLALRGAVELPVGVRSFWRFNLFYPSGALWSEP